jgi:glutamate/aspartate transport system permease protein
VNYNWNWKVFWEPVAAGEGVYWEWLLSGLGWTIATGALAWIIALVFGAAVGTVRTAPVKWLARLGDAYVELFRNIPLIVQMFLWFFVVPELLPNAMGDFLKQQLPYPEFVTAFVSLGLYTSARVAEQVKAGINSLAGGQRYAGLAIGLTTAQTYRYVLLPMAFRIILPPLTSEFMNVFKNSAVALTIGLLELTAQARAMNEYTFQGFETFTAATVLYLIVAMIVNRGMAWLERRVRVPGFIGQATPLPAGH